MNLMLEMFFQCIMLLSFVDYTIRRHSSVDSSTPTILPSWVRIPSTPPTLSIIVKFVLHLSCEKNENKQKEAG